MPYRSTKTFTHETGLSCAFRQWRADSHCRFLHGYALAVRLEFAATHLDERNWVMDFGALAPVKAMLARMFDHKTVIARDDPEMDHFITLHNREVLDLMVIQDVGCEAFARHIGISVQQWLNDYNHQYTPGVDRVWLHSCEVREHGGNSAIWLRD